MFAIIIRTANGNYYRETEYERPNVDVLFSYERNYAEYISDLNNQDAVVVNVYEVKES